MNEIVSLTLELERGGKGKLFGCYSVEIDGEKSTRVGDTGFHFNGVDEGFRKSAVFERREVEAVDVVPDWSVVSGFSYVLCFMKCLQPIFSSL